MATFTIIVDGAIDAESPLTDDVLFALRDNLQAAFEGALNAPRLLGTGVARETEGASGSLPVLPVSAADTYTIVTGLKEVIEDLTISNIYPETDAVSYTVTAFTGSLRFKMAHPGTLTTRLKIYKNGVEQASWSTASTTLRTYDMSVVPGDTVKWTHEITSGVGNTTLVNWSVTASDAYLPQTVYGQATLL